MAHQLQQPEQAALLTVGRLVTFTRAVAHLPISRQWHVMSQRASPGARSTPGSAVVGQLADIVVADETSIHIILITANRRCQKVFRLPLSRRQDVAPIEAAVMSIPSLPTHFAAAGGVAEALVSGLASFHGLQTLSARLVDMPPPERYPLVGAETPPAALLPGADRQMCGQWIRAVGERTFWFVQHICRGSAYCRGGFSMPHRFVFQNGQGGSRLQRTTHSGEEIGECVISALLECIPGIIEVRTPHSPPGARPLPAGPPV